MTNLSFDITTARDFYNKLKEDILDFKSAPTSSRLAINCAMTSWHLGEWIFNEFHDLLSPEFVNVKAYQLDLRTSQCPSLEIMRLITNGSKHCQINSTKNKIVSTAKHSGVFSNAFSKQFDISYLYINLEDGAIVRFGDILEEVVAFWDGYVITKLGWKL